MDMHEMVKHHAERTKEHMLKIIDRIYDEAEDDHRCLYETEIHKIKEAWKAIWYACESAKS